MNSCGEIQNVKYTVPPKHPSPPCHLHFTNYKEISNNNNSCRISFDLFNDLGFIYR